MSSDQTLVYAKKRSTFSLHSSQIISLFWQDSPDLARTHGKLLSMYELVTLGCTFIFKKEKSRKKIHLAYIWVKIHI